MKIALLQCNPQVEDLASNAQAILRFAQEAKKQQVSLLVTPAFALSGYHPKDLLLRDDFFEAMQQQIRVLAQIRGITLLVGHPTKVNNQLFNAATIIQDGQIIAQYYQMLVSEYPRALTYFTSGSQKVVWEHGGCKIGIAINQDVFSEEHTKQIIDGIDGLVILQAIPFCVGQYAAHSESVACCAKHFQTPILCANLVGGQDEWVFDGGSFAVNRDGACVARAPFYEESLLVLDIEDHCLVPQQASPVPSRLMHIYQTLVLSVRDYVHKNHFSSVLLGLSGGIDSALTLAIATDALGSDKVNTVMMPSCYTSAMSINSAKKMANDLKVTHHKIDIWPIYQQMVTSLSVLFANQPEDVTEENIQARIRGMLLMALANKKHSLVLATGNKSELATGYCTLYGDMVGGFAVLKDVSKSLVYELAAWRNASKVIIPLEIIQRPPSAELKPNQTDQDRLPPYDVLDAIITEYVENHTAVATIIAKGYQAADVYQVIDLLVHSEYKRQQGPIGPCITRRSFGSHWHYPVAHHFVSS